MADVRTPELVINKLSKQQYENIQNPSDTEIYLVPEDEEHKPICYPTTASEVGTTSMLVKSSVSDNGKMLTENGFVYNTSGNPTVSDNKVICDLGVGVMEKVMENLTQNTEYHIKSYGQNSSGLVYGSELVQRTSCSPIPSEYQLVEYIRSATGVQYIDTGVSTISIYRWFMQMKINSTPSIHSGSGAQTSNAFYRMGCLSTGRLYLHFGAGGTEVDVVANDQNMHQWEININDAIYRIDNNYVFLNCSRPSNEIIYLFIPKGVMARYIDSSIYECEFNDIQGNSIIHLYSVYRKADNKPGMYDIVNNVFYTNQGTGEFIVGPDAVWSE